MWINSNPTMLDLFDTHKQITSLSYWVRISLYPWILLLVWGFICSSTFMIAAGGLLFASGLIFMAILEVEREELRVRISKWQGEN